MDHVATLPIFIDDLFGTLTEPIRVHATEEVIGLLERDVFNWTVYPRFSELSNQNTRVMEYVPFRTGEEFRVAHVRVTAVPVNHIVPTVGLIISDGSTNLAFSSDTAATEQFWHLVNSFPRLHALLIEASFPNELAQLAVTSGHLTPASLGEELRKLVHRDTDILAVHLKPAFRQKLIEQLAELQIPRLHAMEGNREYEW